MKEFKDYLDRKMQNKKDLFEAMNEAHKNRNVKKQSSIEWYLEQVNILSYRYAGKVITLGEYVNEKNIIEKQLKELYKNEHRETWIESSKSLTNIVDVNKSFDIYYQTTYENE